MSKYTDKEFHRKEFLRFIRENLRFDWCSHFYNLLSSGQSEAELWDFIRWRSGIYPELQTALTCQLEKALLIYSYKGKDKIPKKAPQ